MIDYVITCSDPTVTDISYSYLDYGTSDEHEGI